VNPESVHSGKQSSSHGLAYRPEVTRVIHTIAGLHPDSGGPARSVTCLVSGLTELEGLSVVLLSNRVGNEAVYWGELDNNVLRFASTRSRLYSLSGIPLQRSLANEIAVERPAIIHDHGIWLPSNWAVARLASKKAICRIVHVRGMLEPWALSFHSARKKIAWSLYQHRQLASAALFIASSPAEAENIRKLGFRQPIAVIGNGVHLPIEGARPVPVNPAARRRNLVFIGRIHPIKGLLRLLDVWAKLRPEGWILVLAGPDDGGHLQEVMAKARIMGIDERVEYRGPVEGDAKARLLKSADLFILPSFSENFGMVVAEALSYSIPVIATTGTPWNDLVERGCGWWVPTTDEALANAIGEAISLSDQARNVMGARGRQYVRQFDWKKIALQTAEVYRWLSGRGDCPGCVSLD
jgi:glycosyltransferase involved in cell wall biosynthesis